MPNELKLNAPWLVAVWPGMGHVAISAGYYLMAKLGMHQVGELLARELFDVEHVEVKNGLIQSGRLPRSRFFAWKDPAGKHDIVVFIGEAQPPIGRYAFCQRLVEFARAQGVKRIVTFAAMATQMHPTHESRVFAAATDESGLTELQAHDVQILQEGHIGGLNGVLLGAAAEAHVGGICLLGEMPHIFVQLPFPKAALAVLTVFTKLAAITIDFAELAAQADAMEENLGQLLAQIEAQQAAMQGEEVGEEEESEYSASAQEQGLPQEDERRIEQLFTQAGKDRSKAYELKELLDRLGVFREYEDRFLDLFK